MSEIANPVRDLRTGWWTIYQGGRHVTVCDGAGWHHNVHENGTTKDLRVHACDNWEGGGSVARMLAEVQQ